MKRFYCTICKRVKRVQEWPTRITDATTATHANPNGSRVNFDDQLPHNPTDRLGECMHHANGRIHTPRKPRIFVKKVTSQKAGK